jgi:glycosyltransferase involved in cell wall biosynthesis
VSGTLRIAIVIPALDEEATIRNVTERALRQSDWVIVVNDGSSDGTAQAVGGLPVTLLSNPRTLGKAASLWRGMAIALAEDADVVVTLDGDGQHEPEDIPRLLATWRERPEAIVIGARQWQRQTVPKMRYFANRFANFWVAWAAGYAIPDSQSGFRLYPAAVLRRVRVARGAGARFCFESEVLIEAGRIGVRSVPVPIAAVYPPQARPSHFRPVADLALIVRMVAWKLLSRGLYLSGLVRSLRR